MDPRLIDLVWEVQREAGTECRRSRSFAATARRKPTPCSAAAARVSRAFSQHMLGRAMDFYVPGIPLEAAARDRLALGARRRRLLSGIRLAVRAYGHRRHPHVAAHDARAARPRLPGRTHGADSDRRQADARLHAGARRCAKARRRAVAKLARCGARRRRSTSARWWSRATIAPRQIRSPDFWAWRKTCQG